MSFNFGKYPKTFIIMVLLVMAFSVIVEDKLTENAGEKDVSEVETGNISSFNASDITINQSWLDEILENPTIYLNPNYSCNLTIMYGNETIFKKVNNVRQPLN